jgi:hypothetical protein
MIDLFVSPWVGTLRPRELGFSNLRVRENRHVPWMQEAEKTGLLKLLESREHSAASREEFLRTKMHLEAIEAQMRAAIAEERVAAALELAANAAVKNVRYMSRRGSPPRHPCL